MNHISKSAQQVAHTARRTRLTSACLTLAALGLSVLAAPAASAITLTRPTISIPPNSCPMSAPGACPARPRSS